MDTPTARALIAILWLAGQQPECLPLLSATCACSGRGGTFTPAAARRELGSPARLAQFRRLTALGLLERSHRGSSVNRRLYYRMPHRDAVKRALVTLGPTLAALPASPLSSEVAS
ncbi:MAG TPA: hypothetical protein VMT50_04775 [Steroidobacteraceae bacterium]|nr:hypothetical protein [Steroidobacteraceae bacterium]